MGTTLIITAAALLLILGIGISGYIQMREHKRAEKRAKVAKLRYKAREGQDLYDRFYEYPIGPDARIVILQYIMQNFALLESYHINIAVLD